MSDEEGLAQVAKLIEDYEKCVSIEDAVHILMLLRGLQMRHSLWDWLGLIAFMVSPI